MKHHNPDPGPLWSAAFLLTLCHAFDAKAWPALSALALISAVISAAGLLSQFSDPDIYDFLLCVLMGTNLWMIARIFWSGAWNPPHIDAKKPLVIFTLVAALGFSSHVAVSVTANLSATAGEVSLGYRRIGVLLERKGMIMNHKKLYRIYTEEKLGVRRRRARKRARGSRTPMPVALRPGGPSI